MGRADPLILQRRVEIKDAYALLLTEHPALPPEIRDFQVQLETCSLVFNCSQADVTAAVLSQDSHHILSSVPTGWGKTLPMLLAALLMPPGDTIPYFFDDSLDHCTPGSTTSILVPLTTIALQLKAECDKLGISALLSSEVLKMHVTPKDFCSKKGSFHQVGHGPGDLERELLQRPTILIMSVEFLASNEVKCRCHPPMNCTVPKWVKFNLFRLGTPVCAIGHFHQ